MTSPNIKKLIKEYQDLDKDQLVLVEFRKQEILDQLKRESSLFLTTADEFQFALREIFSQSMCLPLNCVRITSKIRHCTRDNSSNYIYQIKQTLQLKIKKEIFNQTLPEAILISKDEMEDIQFTQNLYTISLIPILLESNMKNSNLIHQACWIIFEKNLKTETKKEYSIF